VVEIAKQGIYWFCALVLTGVVKVLFRVRFVGRENIPPHGAIVVARHASYWDIPLAVALLHWRKRVNFVARHTLLSEHLLLKPFIAGYALTVDRDSFRMSDFKKVMRAIETNELVAVFPEGTIQQTDRVYTGVIRFAERSKREFLPIRFKVRSGQDPPRYPFGFPALTAVVGVPFSLRDLEFDLNGNETKAERYDRLARLLMKRVDHVEA
jgi:1-acyl-sn-glycerol-3-phosphate acyltransferase